MEYGWDAVEEGEVYMTKIDAISGSGYRIIQKSDWESNFIFLGDIDEQEGDLVTFRYEGSNRGKKVSNRVDRDKTLIGDKSEILGEDNEDIGKNLPGGGNLSPDDTEVETSVDRSDSPSTESRDATVSEDDDDNVSHFSRSPSTMGRTIVGDELSPGRVYKSKIDEVSPRGYRLIKKDRWDGFSINIGEVEIEVGELVVFRYEGNQSGKYLAKADPERATLISEKYNPDTVTGKNSRDRVSNSDENPISGEGRRNRNDLLDGNH